MCRLSNSCSSHFFTLAESSVSRPRSILLRLLGWRGLLLPLPLLRLFLPLLSILLLRLSWRGLSLPLPLPCLGLPLPLYLQQLFFCSGLLAQVNGGRLVVALQQVVGNSVSSVRSGQVRGRSAVQ